MTDLDSRQQSRPGARDRGTPQAPGPKPPTLSALVAAGAALLTGLLACTAVAVVGWLAATFGGASGAVRAGAFAWLAAHKAAVQLPGGAISLAPLGLTLFVLVCLFKAGRFAARVSEADLAGDLVKASVVLAIGYGGGAALVALLGSGGDLRVSPLTAFLAAGSLALAAGGTGVLVESGAADDILDATPDWLRDSVTAGLASTAAVLAGAAVLVSISLILHFGRAADMVRALDPGPVGAVVLFAICAALVPNAIVYAVAFLAGPGFQLGTATTVAPTGVELGNVPALPLLAAVPRDGATPSYLLVLTAVLPLVAGAAGGLVLGRRAGMAVDRGESVGLPGLAGRAMLSGLVAGVVLLVAMLLASGAAGPGRMAHVGVPTAVIPALFLAVGTALGAVATALAAGTGRPAG